MFTRACYIREVIIRVKKYGRLRPKKNFFRKRLAWLGNICYSKVMITNVNIQRQQPRQPRRGRMVAAVDVS